MTEVLTDEQYPLALWRRITKVATKQPCTWPDMDRLRFAEILSRTRGPSSLDIAKIAERFNVTVEWLIYGDDHGNCEEVIAELRRWCHGQIAHQQSLEDRISVLTQRLEDLGGDISG